MPYLLRKARRNRWYTGTDAHGSEWLPENHRQSEVFKDLAAPSSSPNSLSVWLVDDDRGNIDDIVIALASTCEHLSNLDYVLFPVAGVEDIGIALGETPGETPYAGANHLHRDLQRLTASHVAGLATMPSPPVIVARVREKKVRELLSRAVSQNKLNPSDLKESLRNKVVPAA